jgi:hypothetical protein
MMKRKVSFLLQSIYIYIYLFIYFAIGIVKLLLVIFWSIL